MTEPDRWTALRAFLPTADFEPDPGDLEPRDRAELWQLLTTYDRSDGTDELTGEQLALDDAVVIVAGAMSEAHVVHRDTWATRRQEVIETRSGLPILSTIDARTLGDRLASIASAP